MRSAILACALVIAACTAAASGDALVENPGSGAASGCRADSDCVAASSSCCECPTFALAAASGWQSSCDRVSCDPAPSCGEVRAACDRGACTLACVPIACEQSCAGGFAVDGAGCQVCACAAAAPAQCALDTDCARVAADCCGCAKGGADTAIPAAEVATHDASLMCSSAPACPGVDVCDPGVAARCDGGRCALEAAPATNATLPPGACGRPDLPACGAGLRCVLNGSQEAEAAGVGVCAP